MPLLQPVCCKVMSWTLVTDTMFKPVINQELLLRGFFSTSDLNLSLSHTSLGS